MFYAEIEMAIHEGELEQVKLGHKEQYDVETRIIQPQGPNGWPIAHVESQDLPTLRNFLAWFHDEEANSDFISDQVFYTEYY